MTPALRVAGNKYGAVRSYSALIQREFASKAECERAEELWLLQRAGEIGDLEFEPRWVLSDKPRVTYKADFAYYDGRERGWVVEDVKGALTRDTRTKLAWLKQLYGVEVWLLRKTRDGWEQL